MKNQTEIQALENRLDHNRRLHEKNVFGKNKQMTHLSKVLREAIQDNKVMREDMSRLCGLVDCQDHIQGALAHSSGAHSQGGKRMKALVTRRKLQDIVRAQALELDDLRCELDRTRRRNFPSFGHDLVQYAALQA
eukprot:scaffold579_cov546-Prasinococcus_capsulatus_cf.AAC.6